jgi:general stress protein 26
MADKAHSRAEVEDRLWREIKKHNTVMLGLAGGPPRHMQPMAAFFDEHVRKGLWFFVQKGAHLLKETGSGHAAMMCVMQDQAFIACVGGTLSEDYNRDLIEKFWNPVVAAWFPEGKDDPRLTLLHLEPEDAQVWISSGSAIRFGWEVAKANFTKREPDVGETAHIRF